MTDNRNTPGAGSGPEPPDFLALAEAAVMAAERQPHNVDLLLRAAELCLRAGDITRATGFARDAVAVDATSFRGLRTLSGILDAAGRRAEAIQFGHDAARLKPADAEARLHLGSLLAAERRWREAAEHLSVHVMSAAATPRGWRLLSSVLSQAGQIDAAIDAASHAISADPNIIEYRLNLASLLSVAGHYDRALEELNIALVQAPDSALLWRTISGIHAARSDLTEALKAAQRAVEIAGNDPACHANLEHVAGLCALPVGRDGATADPARWLPRPRRPITARPPRWVPGLWDDIATRWQVIYAMILRGIRTKFGHTRLGYVWAIMEPISHLLTLGVVFFSLNHNPAPVGENLFLYYVTGLAPYLMFSHVSHEVMEAAEANQPMLQLPIVKRTDVILAQGIRQFATELCVGSVIFSIAALMNLQGAPADPLTSMAAIALLWLLAMGIGAFNLVICEFFPSYETFFNALVRLLYFSSGIYYSPISMPDTIRFWLEWNPILQAIEFFRSGFYYQYDPHWLDVNYLLIWVLASVVIGFALERATRTKMMVQT